ncbi:NRDE protein-domain-containing protein [Hygrophoropsis aurantiaca]|uniref:NRDE protein-domain-containing protein n=1 Tax=Hygrophoropsis aurantiaca TaxID=72124 RepID=A0ACB8ARA4_9AGAM|nr:NRDE protein-domain-containing protein [Hygrophoropsis aurantiaca]
MCVAFYTLEHPEYALILCANRDEYLSRPTEQAAFHSFGQTTEHSLGDGRVLSGIDIRAGGTWLGIDRSGKIALLTNITEPATQQGSSRGHLVASFLTADSLRYPLVDNLQHLFPRDAKYAGFNLLLLAPSSTHEEQGLSFDSAYVTNRGAGGNLTIHSLTDAQRRCGGISNGIDGKGADQWPKVHHGLHSLQSIIDTPPPHESEEQLAERLFALLTWTSSELPRARCELRNTIQVQPLVIGDSEDYYGTRLSTVILIKRSGEVLFIERDRWKALDDGQPKLANPSSQRIFRFKLLETE